MNVGPIVVVGSVTRDTLIYPESKVTTSLGGILYVVMALAAMTRREIIPIANVGGDIMDEVVRLFLPWPNVSTRGFHRVQDFNIHSYILFTNEYGTQYDVGSVKPVSYSQLKPYLDADFFLVTFPTGFDMRLRTLRHLASSTTAPIHLNYQILTLGRDAHGTRYLKHRRNWLDWISCATFVQLNLFEAEHLADRSLSNDEDLRSFGDHILEAGPSVVNITLGSHGSFVAYRGKFGNAHAHCAPTIVRRPVDPTGCGDVYSAAFVTRFLTTNDVMDSSRSANRVAALKATTSGLESFGELLKATYG